MSVSSHPSDDETVGDQKLAAIPSGGSRLPNPIALLPGSDSDSLGATSESEEDGVLEVSGGTSSIDSTTRLGKNPTREDILKLAVKYAANIWTLREILFVVNPDGVPGWKCRICLGEWQHQNVTKVVAHLSGLGRQNIKKCPTNLMSKPQRILFEEVHNLCNRKRAGVAKAHKRIESSPESHQSAVTATLVSKKLKRAPSSAQSTSTKSMSSNTQPTNREWFAKRAPSPAGVAPSGAPRPKVLRQTKMLPDSPNPESEARLTVAIADMIHSDGLPFLFAESAKFRRVLKLAKTVPTSYNPPIHPTGNLWLAVCWS